MSENIFDALAERRHLMNNRFGPLEGNQVLQLIAAGLEGNCREYDCVARMGSGGFVLVLAGLKPEALSEKLKRIETLVLDAGIPVCGEALVGISAGAAVYPDEGTDAEGLRAAEDRRSISPSSFAKGGNPIPPGVVSPP